MKIILKKIFILSILSCLSCILCLFLASCHNHAYGEWVVEKEATCLEEGEMIRSCRCGEYEAKSTDILLHTPVIDKAIDPTLENTGLTEGSHCSECGTILEAQQIRNKLTLDDIDILSNVRYQGDTSGKLTFYWEINEEYKDTPKRIMLTVAYGDTQNVYKITDIDNTWEYNVQGDQGKYTFTFAPIINDSIQGNSVSREFYWMPNVLELDFPRLEITTENGVLPTFTPISAPQGAWGSSITNDEYVQSIVTLYDSQNQLLYRSSDSSFDAAKIKIRGNTSAYGAKKPFKIKLDEKVDLLEGLVHREDGVDYRDKNWVLLKTGSSFNVAVGSTISSIVGMDWTPAYSYVSLFVNGDFRGLYILIESVEQKESSCDVSDNGYIIEMDSYWWKEDMYFTTPISANRAMKYTFKYPDTDDFDETSEEYLYIKQYMTELENVLTSGGDVSQYADLQSFAKWLLVHDILATYDSGGSNIYMTKYDNTSGSVIRMGPVWDYDSIYWAKPTGNRFATNTFARIRTDSVFYMPYLTQNEQFMAFYRSEYNAVKSQILSAVQTTLDTYDNDTYNTLLEYENMRWGTNSNNTETSIENIMSWFEAHLTWMESNV